MRRASNFATFLLAAMLVPAGAAAGVAETIPCNLRTRWYYAEPVLKRGGQVGGKDAKTVARENLQYVLDNEHCAENPGDGEFSKKAARKLIKDL